MSAACVNSHQWPGTATETCQCVCHLPPAAWPVFRADPAGSQRRDARSPAVQRLPRPPSSTTWPARWWQNSGGGSHVTGLCYRAVPLPSAALSVRVERVTRRGSTRLGQRGDAVRLDAASHSSLGRHAEWTCLERLFRASLPRECLARRTEWGLVRPVTRDEDSEGRLSHAAPLGDRRRHPGPRWVTAAAGGTCPVTYLQSVTAGGRMVTCQQEPRCAELMWAMGCDLWIGKYCAIRRILASSLIVLLYSSCYYFYIHFFIWASTFKVYLLVYLYCSVYEHYRF